LIRLDKDGPLQIIAWAPELRIATGSFGSKWGIADEAYYEVAISLDYPHIAGVVEVTFALFVDDNFYDYREDWFGLIQYKALLNAFQRDGIFYLNDFREEFEETSLTDV
jgi:hypothetical protein